MFLKNSFTNFIIHKYSKLPIKLQSHKLIANKNNLWMIHIKNIFVFLAESLLIDFHNIAVKYVRNAGN